MIYFKAPFYKMKDFAAEGLKDLISLGMSEVDPVWAWGGQTSTPSISKYFSEIFSPSHIKLTNNNLHMDFKSV